MTKREGEMVLELMNDDRWKAVRACLDELKEEGAMAVTEPQRANLPGELAHYAGYLASLRDLEPTLKGRAEYAIALEKERAAN